MSTQIKPIKIWGKGGPNPPKPIMILEELDIPYEAIPISFEDVKKPDFLAINPNGRMPAMTDPNTDITVWESGAIIEYLVDRYDTKHKLSFAPGTAESYHAKQWLFFQVSGQGPYFGQAGWFMRYHPEKVPSAIERYVKEVVRITGVLESHLAKQKVAAGSDGPWLVGDKCSYADISFVMWQTMMVKVLSKEQYNPEDFPHVSQWLDKLCSRKAVKTVLDNLPTH